MASKHKRSAVLSAPVPTMAQDHASGAHAYNPEPECTACLLLAEEAAILASVPTPPAGDTQAPAPQEAPTPPVAPVAPTVHQEAPTAPVAPPVAPMAPTAPVATYLAVHAPTYPKYPTLEQAPTCGTCGTAISGLRPMVRADAPDGTRYHRLCVAGGEAAWKPVGWPRADAPAGTTLPFGVPEGAPVCWGCKVSWKAASRAVVGTDGMPYHRLCAEWAHVLATGTVRAPAAPRASRPADAAVLAQLSATQGALDVAMAALRAAGLLGAQDAPTPPQEAPTVPYLATSAETAA